MDDRGIPSLADLLKGIDVDCETSENRHLQLLKGMEVRMLVVEEETDFDDDDDGFDDLEDDDDDDDEDFDDEEEDDDGIDDDDIADDEYEECGDECRENKPCKRTECLADEAAGIKLTFKAWYRTKKLPGLADQVSAKICKTKPSNGDWKPIFKGAHYNVPAPLLRYINLVWPGDHVDAEE